MFSESKGWCSREKPEVRHWGRRAVTSRIPLHRRGPLTTFCIHDGVIRLTGSHSSDTHRTCGDRNFVRQRAISQAPNRMELFFLWWNRVSCQLPLDFNSNDAMFERPKKRVSKQDTGFIWGDFHTGRASGGGLDSRATIICKKHAVYTALSLSTLPLATSTWRPLFLKLLLSGASAVHWENSFLGMQKRINTGRILKVPPNKASCYFSEISIFKHPNNWQLI